MRLSPLLPVLTALAPVLGAVQDDPPAKLEAWPELDKSLRATVKKDVERVRKAHTEEMGVQGHDALVEVGAACAPELLRALGKEKDGDARERLVAVLLEITGPAHTRLLGQEFDAKDLEVRVFALERSAAFPDPGLREPAEKAFERVTAELDKGKAEPRERLAAALAATAAGSSAALDVIADRAAKAWKNDGARLRTALEGARGDEATDHVLRLLASSDRSERVAALHLLAGCGTTKAVPAVLPLLDEEDGGLRVAAVNALRGMVDGDPPLPKLSVFEVIEHANRWKGRKL